MGMGADIDLDHRKECAFGGHPGLDGAWRPAWDEGTDCSGHLRGRDFSIQGWTALWTGWAERVQRCTDV